MLATSSASIAEKPIYLTVKPNSNTFSGLEEHQQRKCNSHLTSSSFSTHQKEKSPSKEEFESYQDTKSKKQTGLVSWADESLRRMRQVCEGFEIARLDAYPYRETQESKV